LDAPEEIRTWTCGLCGKETFNPPCNDVDTALMRYCDRWQGTYDKGKPETITSDGGSTGYYYLPEDAKELADLIEHKNMSSNVGNIFKACLRLREKSGTDKLYDLNKIIFFAQREKALEEKRQRK